MKFQQPFPHTQDKSGRSTCFAEDLWDAARAWGRATGKETNENIVVGAPPL